MSGAVFPPCYIPRAKLWWASLVAQRLKRLPGMQETRVLSLGREDPSEKEMATHSSTLAWRIPWREEPGRLQSMGSQRVGHNWATSLSNYGAGNEDNGDLHQRIPCMHCYTQCPQDCNKPPPTNACTGDSWTLLSKSGSVPCGVTAPFRKLPTLQKTC